MKTYFIGINRQWESKNGFEIDERDFEVLADTKHEAVVKASQIATEHGSKWSVSYIQEA